MWRGEWRCGEIGQGVDGGIAVIPPFAQLRQQGAWAANLSAKQSCLGRVSDARALMLDGPPPEGLLVCARQWHNRPPGAECC